jgi:hypothetical protein
MANADLLQRTLAQIEAHPDAWNQHNWALRTDCGTSYCFAGWAVTLTHPTARPVFIVGHPVANAIVLNPDTENAEEWQIADLAAHLLQLRTDEADELFDEDNTLDTLRDMVADLVAGASIVPAS